MLALLIVVGIPIFIITFLVVKVLEGFGLKSKEDTEHTLTARVKQLEAQVAELQRAEPAAREVR